MLKYSLLHPSAQELFYCLITEAVRAMCERYGVLGAGVYFCDEVGHPRLHEVFGDRANAEMLSQEAMNNAIRLRWHSGHTSSWESRDPQMEYYGGAIRFPNKCILSVSGFSEEVNEALAGAVGSLLGWISESQIEDILIPHGTQALFETIRESIKQHC